jgi:hypothetical protein
MTYDMVVDPFSLRELPQALWPNILCRAEPDVLFTYVIYL